MNAVTTLTMSTAHMMAAPSIQPSTLSLSSSGKATPSTMDTTASTSSTSSIGSLMASMNSSTMFFEGGCLCTFSPYLCD